MGRQGFTAAALGIVLAVQPMAEATAAIVGAPSLGDGRERQAQTIQYPDRPALRPRPGPPGPRYYPGWRGEPGWRGAPAWRGPAGWAGRPYWYGRPWVRRPYYGTIFAGVALGTLITVAAVGAVPPRPHPDLCWYWADPYGNSGYWDYC